MATMFDFGFLEENLTHLTIFGQSWIVSTVFIFLLIFIITRRVDKFSTLFLPMAIAVKTIGFYIPLPIYVGFVTFGGFLFIMSAIGTETMGNFIRGGTTLGGKLARNQEGLFGTTIKDRRISTIKKSSVLDGWKTFKDTENLREQERLANIKGRTKKLDTIDIENIQKAQDRDYLNTKRNLELEIMKATLDKKLKIKKPKSSVNYEAPMTIQEFIQ